jgi:hypothetical protein
MKKILDPNLSPEQLQELHNNYVNDLKANNGIHSIMQNEFLKIPQRQREQSREKISRTLTFIAGILVLIVVVLSIWNLSLLITDQVVPVVNLYTVFIAIPSIVMTGAVKYYFES